MKNPRLIDLTGKRFGGWIVIEQAGNNARGGALWRCRCDCGTVRAVNGADLRNEKSVSCGCLGSRAMIGKIRRSHGESGTPLYQVWKNMRARCRNPSTEGFKNYGGRGIAICAEWDEFAVFAEWAKSSGYRDDLSIERINVNGNYCPENCTWADAATQNANRRFNRRAPDGELWWHKARANGVTWAAYSWRRARGWPMEKVISWPLGKRHPRPRNDSGQFT